MTGRITVTALILAFLISVGVYTGCRQCQLKSEENFFRPAEGRYQIQPGGVKLFDGGLKIVYLRGRGSSLNPRFTLIYDQMRHGFVCTHIDQETYFVCSPVITKNDNITNQDQTNVVLQNLFPEFPMFFVKFKKQGKNLEIWGYSMYENQAECERKGNCPYSLLSVLRKIN